MKTDHVVALMGRALKKANCLISEELGKRGHTNLAPTHGDILAKLYAEGTQPMGALAKKIHRKKNTLTTLIKKLEKAGYVKRTTASEDSRVILVSLTSKGEAFRKDFEEVSKVLLSTVWKDMPQIDKETLVAGLEKIVINLA